MKVLKGLVLTMLVSTATIFSMNSSFVDDDSLTTDGLTIDQIGVVGDSVVVGAYGNVVDGSTTFADTVGQSSPIPLTSVEVSTTILTRLANNDSLDKTTRSVVSTVLSSLGKGTNSTEDAITALTGLTSGSELISVGVLNTIQSVLGVLTSDIAGTPTWNVTTTGVITPSGVVFTDLEASGVDSGVILGEFTVTASEEAAINLSRAITTASDALGLFTLSSLLKASIDTKTAEDTVNVIFATLDRLDAIIHDTTTDVVDAVSDDEGDLS